MTAAVLHPANGYGQLHGYTQPPNTLLTLGGISSVGVVGLCGEGLVWGWGSGSVRWGVDDADDDRDDDGDDEDGRWCWCWCWWSRRSCPERVWWFGKLVCEWLAEGGGVAEDEEEEEEDEEAAMLVLLFKAAMLERTFRGQKHREGRDQHACKIILENKHKVNKQTQSKHKINKLPRQHKWESHDGYWIKMDAVDTV